MEKANYSLKFTPAASDDLETIYQYISNELHNESAAGYLMDKIETNFLRLKDFPFSCNYVADETLERKGYRKLIVDNYIGFYIVEESKQEVIIMRVLYGRKKYQDLI
ncbi:type II toxin-antitoxin system RelE/ParE family toxin [Alkalihalobacillus sp. LMS39]|uniref:type II toxin-antitoxin system RelE/ParE family toxin n=1 Tax=Alkalihalobacillus sp. LMS39 TaxID=2924032 RepID=UPI001FB4638D|nr:type II toxin-antitoxin system RelE/ParE family toxin [Alkalihalobacillus sp. LMS39]UOE93617.1 type II toxin-antitoxin system RelE/ParE family toxin [Alkalihalobacillus sp. LMS39]